MLRRDPLRERRGLRPPRMRGRRVTSFSLYRMIPNILTLLALCAGMTAIRFAMVGKYEAAAVAIIVAGVFDGLDGRAARLLKANTSFGAQLDSLSDFISFGVAPAVVLYAWTMSELFTLGWVIVLFYAACCALRLARFNTQLDVELPPYASNYFTGVPAPAAAGVVLVPMFFAFEWGDAFIRSPWVNAVVIGGVAALMVSRIPTLSLKKIRIQHHQVVPTLLGVGVLAALFTTAPWPVMTVVGLAYVATIPATWYFFQRQKRAYETSAPQPAAAPPGSDVAGYRPAAAADETPVATRH